MLLNFASVACERRLDREINKIRKMQLEEVVIEWMMEETKEASEIISVYSSREKRLLRRIIEAFSDVKRKSGNPFFIMQAKSIGRICLKGKDRFFYTDVTECGYFIGGRRNLDMLFYSSSLTGIISQLLNAYDDKDRLVVPEGLFKTLSGEDLNIGQRANTKVREGVHRFINSFHINEPNHKS